mgnify:CR=1 FL=1
MLNTFAQNYFQIEYSKNIVAMYKFIKTLFITLFISWGCVATAQLNSIPKDGEIFVNPEFGDNLNNGTKDYPIKSVYEAAQRINHANGKGAITIYLSKGIHGLDKTVTFHPANWHFTKENRLTIRAEILPDSIHWDQGQMPVIVSTMPLNFKPYGNYDPLHGASYGLQIETSHVTIQGLRVLGTPVHETPKEGYVKRNYPIVREGMDLTDLRITQCLFLGDIHAIPNHLSILASGHGIEVDHCVFYGVKDAVVFWQSNTPAIGCSMHHNLIVDNYGGAVWAWTVAADFKYYNNVVSNTNVFWEIGKNEQMTYNLSNSIVLGYNELVNKNGGAFGYGEPADTSKLIYKNDVIIKKKGEVELDKNPTSKNYLHLKPGSIGSELGVGLFMK